MQAFNLREMWEQDATRFGRVEPLYLVSTGHGFRQWRCRCSCGVEFDCRQANLVQRRTKSCGCLQRELAATLAVRRGVVHNRLAEGEASCRALYRRYQRDALHRSIGWDIDLDLFREVTTRACYICGREPGQVYQHCPESFGAYIHNGIDRVDNSLGYEPGNVAPCCATCNQFKMDRGYEEILDHALRIVRYNGLEGDHGN